MATFAAEKSGLFETKATLRRGRMAPCFYGVASTGRMCQSAINRWPMTAVSPTYQISKGTPWMGLRALIIAAALVGSAQVGSSEVAEAGEQSVLRRVSCSMVRFYVAKYSQGAAEAYARSKGATEAEIENARRCLKGSPVITAQNTMTQN
jgi:hypothetical protein